MKAQELIGMLRSATIYGEEFFDKEIHYLVNDNRKISKNSCFIAIKGETFDGHNVIESAVNQGATVIIVEELREEWLLLPVTIVLVSSTYRAQAILANAFYMQPTTHLNVVAITGTNGKTTTSSMISDWLMQLNHKTGLLGTLHYKVDQKYYPAVNTTPNALELQRLFSEMITVGCTDAIIEASSHALQLGRLWYTDVDCAIFTNLTREHLDFHHTMDQYAAAKSLLFSQMGQKYSSDKPKVAIINIDSHYHQVMTQVTSADVVTYSIKNNQATVYADNITHHSEGVSFDIHVDNQSYSVRLKMFGEYNVSNYLAAFACLKYYYGYATVQIIQAADPFEGVNGRMQRINEGQDFGIVVDFAHTPDAIENVLMELKKNTTGRLITVIGHSGGNRDSGARPEIGDIVFNYSDYIIFTADNPRHESVEKICYELIGLHDEIDYQIIVKREDAVFHALKIAQKGDVIAFLGKGGEPYQVIGDDYLPYQEDMVIRQMLKNK